METTSGIVWFRRDLRVEDNPALLSAARAGSVIPVFIWCPEEEGQFRPGRGSRWWLKESLIHLDSILKSLGGPLIIRKAEDSLRELLDIAKATGATRVFYNHLYDPISLLRDHRIKQGLSQNGIAVSTFNGDLLYEPWEVTTKEGQAFTTFEAFWQRYMCMPFEPEPPTLPPRRLRPSSYEGYFKAWRQGRTGYPLVDAGMRELWATGWLHNRIRVVVSSFCVKMLQLPWRWGMKYFWDSLLDADLECDVLGWQYISGSLPDGHELDRLESPQVVGYELDPDGEYVRKWLPELSRLPSEWIHHPWDAPPHVLRAAGIELGYNYPRPIVDILAAKERLQRAIELMWEREAAASNPPIPMDDPESSSSGNASKAELNGTSADHKANSHHSKDDQ